MHQRRRQGVGKSRSSEGPRTGGGNSGGEGKSLRKYRVGPDRIQEVIN